MTPRPLRAITLKLASADEIRALSGGEVTADAALNDSGAPVPGGLFCPSVFGKDGRSYGHIELACPVVHPWYDEAVRLLTGLEDLSDGHLVQDALRAVDLESRFAELHGQANGSPSRGLRFVAVMRKSGVKPESLVIEALPVVPPNVRPVVRMPDGAALSSDLNEHYRRVVARSNALRTLMERTPGRRPGAYAIDARDGLTTAVRGLIGTKGDSALESLTDLLVSRSGFLKRNLFGKRVDYSGRSVIVAGPDLELHQCGLPREMALVLFMPFVARRMVEMGASRSTHAALQKIASDPGSDGVRNALEQVALEKLVLLNRAPTLHRLGIQPFQPVLTDDRAMSLHPLVCCAFNADFDGDQMAVHVPISGCAQQEARELLNSAVNLVLPANGKPITSPVQDMTLGLWYLTAEPRGEVLECEDAEELIAAVDEGDVHPHAPVILRDEQLTGEAELETTAGRVVLNAHLPEELRFVNRQVGKGEQAALTELCLERCGRKRTRQMLDDLDRLGFRWATTYAPSYGLGVTPAPESVERLRAGTRDREEALRAEMASGAMSESEFRGKLAALWADAAFESRRILREELGQANDGLNPLSSIVTSGSRSNWNFLGSTFGIPGPMWRGPGADDEYGSFEAPVESGFWDGCSQIEHFERAFGARKGLADTSLKIDFAFDIMRHFIYAGQSAVVTAADCGADDGIEVRAVEFGGQVVESLATRIRGRVAARDIADAGGAVLVASGEMITREQAEAVQAAGIESAVVRSVLKCGEPDGVCATCYGEDLACGTLVAVGSAVGVVAAQAIAEPAVQLTFRTFVGPMLPGKGPGSPAHPGGLVELADLFDGKSPELAPEELVENAQRILGFQGVEVHDKHFEMIARRMYGFTRIDDPGDTWFVAGDTVADKEFETENARLAAAGGRPATGSPAVLGTREAAMHSSSVIGSAAVGNSREILALAALAGARDELPNTLERIVAGLAPKLRG